LNSFRVIEETEDFIEVTRAGIAPLIGSPLALLKKYKFDQEEYAEASLVIVKMITDLIDSEYEKLEGDEIDDTSSKALKFLLAFDTGDETSFNSISSGLSRAYIDDQVGYRVFTRQYDSEERITELIRHDQLVTLRENLDKEVYNSHINIKRFAKSLHEVFAEPLEIDWNFGEEEGYVDGRRLSQLVASKSEKRVFFLPRVEKKVNAQLTLLIDCSGSMKEYGSDVAVLIDILGRALVLAGVNVEILGFTTNTWSGGRPQTDWFSQGRPMCPGRLNEVRHIIFKTANTKWHKARRAIAGLLKPDIFKESVDGEAIEWALSRLESSDATRKSIVVVSDGCPMDSATNLANDKFYLDNHLKEVVKNIELSGNAEVFGLGVGLDLSAYYSKCAALDLGEGVNQKVLDEIVALLQKKHRR
jgi:cobaltochelatase CobT